MHAITNDRKRLYRDIHDAVGYTLTNIIMLLEEASLVYQFSFPPLVLNADKNIEDTSENILRTLLIFKENV